MPAAYAARAWLSGYAQYARHPNFVCTREAPPHTLNFSNEYLFLYERKRIGKNETRRNYDSLQPSDLI